MKQLLNTLVTVFDDAHEFVAKLLLKRKRDARHVFNHLTVAFDRRADLSFRLLFAVADFVFVDRKSIEPSKLQLFLACGATIGLSLPQLISRAGEGHVLVDGNSVPRFVRKNVLTTFGKQS